jgi:hypothetical protein
MALGRVSVNNQNLGQGTATEVERLFLFIGPGAKNIGQVIALNTESDLDVQLGIPASDLKTQIIAARANGGDRWNALAMPIAADGDWLTAFTYAQQHGYDVEAVVITKPVATAAELSSMNTAAVSVQNTYGRRLFILAATAGIDSATWAEYQTAQRDLVKDLVADRVIAVPQLHGNNLGVLAGRLANAAVSIADTPMRVATGALQGLGDTPMDNDNVPLQTATSAVLDAARLSVPQTYAGYPGMYWADANMLVAPGSDADVIEHLRVLDKAARRVRVLLIQRIGDRRLNSSSASMEVNRTALMAPLRQMAKSTKVGANIFPGEIEQPGKNSITLTWTSKTAVVAYLTLRPLNCPKDITANLALDLSLSETE